MARTLLPSLLLGALLVGLLAFLSACQRSTYPLGQPKADPNNPEYTFQPDVNQALPK